jgi:hypothetical protein
MRRRAEALGERIRAEDGVRHAVAAFERHVCQRKGNERSAVVDSGLAAPANPTLL